MNNKPNYNISNNKNCDEKSPKSNASSPKNPDKGDITHEKYVTNKQMVNIDSKDKSLYQQECHNKKNIIKSKKIKKSKITTLINNRIKTSKFINFPLYKESDVMHDHNNYLNYYIPLTRDDDFDTDQEDLSSGINKAYYQLKYSIWNDKRRKKLSEDYGSNVEHLNIISNTSIEELKKTDNDLKNLLKFN